MKETRFKNTELGPIPVDWEVTTIINFSPLQRGYDLPTKDIKVGDIPVVYSNGICNYHNQGMCMGPGVVTGRSGTIGKFTFIERGLYWPHNTSLWVTNFYNNCPKFVYYLLQRQSFANEYAGSGVPSLNRNSVHNKLIAFPLKEEQERIAEALSDVDALIAELGELIEKKRLVKQGTMQQLLTASRRLPGFSKPWVEYKLGEIGVFSKGKGISKAETTSEGLPCIRYGEIYTNHHDYIKSFVSYISQQTAMDSVALRKGQILFTASGETKEEIGKAVAFNLDLEAYAGGDIIIFTPTIQCDPIFMGYVMNTPDVNSQKSALGQGDAVVHIGAVALSTISVFIPDISEQRAIAEILTDMDNEIAELEAKREKYRAIKEGMMQQLLTGRIRLIDPTASTDSATSVASSNPAGVSPHAPVITYEPTTAYPHSLAAEPTILE